jgi:diacylglycerol kinase (ATP)
VAWSVIVNPSAGRGRTTRVLPSLQDRLDRLPLELTVHVSQSFDDARVAAAKAAAEGHDLVACGGDGIVGLLAGVAADHGVRLAIVPTGSGNDFATTLGYDRKRPLDAIEALLGGRDRTVDLGRANGTWYAGITCSGFDAEANRWANDVTWLSGTPLYVAAVFRTLVRFRPQRFRVTVDGDAHELDAWMVSVGNNRRYAGGMHITPDARLDDGLLDVCVVDGSLSPLQLVVQFPKVFSGRHVGHPAISMWRGREIEVEAIDSALPLEVWADGERVGPLPATMTAVPDALIVRAPA